MGDRRGSGRNGSKSNGIRGKSNKDITCDDASLLVFGIRSYERHCDMSYALGLTLNLMIVFDDRF